MRSLLQIIKVNEARSGTKNDRAWKMQDAECILFNEDGSVDAVGVLMLPKDLQEKVQIGTYEATFRLRPNLASRRIEAQIVTLVAAAKPAPAPASAASASK